MASASAARAAMRPRVPPASRGSAARYRVAPRASPRAAATRAARFVRAKSQSSSVVSASTSEPACATDDTGKMVCVEETKGVVFPSNLRCALQVIVPTPEVDDPAYSLSDYMRLPVDQYVGIELPMGAQMKRVPGSDSLFQLEIPGLKFLSLEVKPVVRVRVRLIDDGEVVQTWTGQRGEPGGKSVAFREEEAAAIAAAEEKAREAEANGDDASAIEIPVATPMGRPEREDVALIGPCVLIEAISCRVEGKVVEELGVNDLFVFRGTTCFRWRSAGDDSLAGPPLRRTGPGGEEEEPSKMVVGKAREDESVIAGWADIGVGVDPPGAFALLPQSFAEKVGDAVMRTTLKALQTVFLKGLGADYQRWASDAEYRAAREVAAKEAAAEAARELGDRERASSAA